MNSSLIFFHFRAESSEEEIKHETSSITSNPPPDVLSGLENVTISQHLEKTENDVETNTYVEPNSPTMSKSSSSEFESIYDKYRDKSDDEQATAQDETQS